MLPMLEALCFLLACRFRNTENSSHGGNGARATVHSQRERKPELAHIDVCDDTGYRCPGGTKIDICLSGTYAEGNAAECSSCPQGSFSENAAASCSFLECPANSIRVSEVMQF